MRFVILRHEGSARGLHWDFMLEVGAVLQTWALATEPAAGELIAAEKLADHRLAYLEYEGPVSNDRGLVKRWDHGVYESIAETPRRVELILQGDRLSGRCLLTASEHEPQRWTFTLTAAPTSGADSSPGG